MAFSLKGVIGLLAPILSTDSSSNVGCIDFIKSSQVIPLSACLRYKNSDHIPPLPPCCCLQWCLLSLVFGFNWPIWCPPPVQFFHCLTWKVLVMIQIIQKTCGGGGNWKLVVDYSQILTWKVLLLSGSYKKATVYRDAPSFIPIVPRPH